VADERLRFSEPDEGGHFGPFGGRYVPETLMPALLELEAAFKAAMADDDFRAELDHLHRTYTNRPSPLYEARRLSEALGGPRIFLKREDLNHTGAHKINNALAQALLARRMGKRRVIAETGAGQHGVAAATAAALLGLECVVFMGREDMRRQAINVFRMELLGARVEPVDAGARTLKEAASEALRHWVTHVRDTYYILGSAVGPHPYPLMVRTFQSVIGQEARQQMLAATGRLPDVAVAAVGGGSNSIGLFHPFIGDPEVALVGVEAAGEGLAARHAATLSAGAPGVLHGAYSYVLQDEDGQILEAHSISAGLDYPGVGPEHAYLKATGRARYEAVTDAEAVDALGLLARTEGIVAALESAHAVAWVVREARTLGRDRTVLVCLSGRGDKDVAEVERWLRAHKEGAAC
jgi:tryptophan synthase beta chain